MDILKNLFKTTAAAMVLILFAACNFELKSDGSKPSPQKEEVPTEEPAKKEVAATYVNKDAAMFGVEMKIDFYTDGTWLAYDDVMDEEGASIALVGLYKGTYEGNASEDGTLKIKIIDRSDVAELIETESLLSLMSEIEAAIAAAGENAELPIKYEVKWSAYDDNEEKSYTVAKGKLNIFDADFIRDGYVPDETEPVDEPIETPVEDPEEKPDDTEINKTLVAKYASKKDSFTGLILTVEFYSDGTWLAYDDIHGAETSADSEGNSESKEYTFAYVDLYKGTYTGKPAEDGKITIVTTHNTVISNLRGSSKYSEEIENELSNIGKDAELPVRFTDTWLPSAKVETEVTISKGKMNVFDTDLYKDGKYEDESDPAVEEPEVTKEIVARYLGKDEVGKIFIELYKDGTFLEYDVIDFGEGVSMQLDLYKGTYEGNPAEDGVISFNITNVSTMLRLSNESMFAQMQAQLLEAGENAVYPVKFKGDWQAVSQSATVTVKNGRAKVLGFDVVREGTPDDEPLFDSDECILPVSNVFLDDGNWTLKIITDQNHLFNTLTIEEKNKLLNNYSGTEKDAVEALITAESESDFYIIVPVEKLVQAVTYKLELKDSQVSAVNDVSAYSLVAVKNDLYKDIVKYMAVNFKNMTYEWTEDTGTLVEIMSDEELAKSVALGQYMLGQALEQDNWKSNADGSMYCMLDDDMTAYLAKE